MDSSYLLILAILLGCLASTIPVFIALFFTGMFGLVYLIGIDPQIVIEVLYRSMDKFALIVVLFFVLCGNIMTTGSIVEKLIKTANVFVGFLPGGLAMAGVLACGSVRSLRRRRDRQSARCRFRSSRSGKALPCRAHDR